MKKIFKIEYNESLGNHIKYLLLSVPSIKSVTELSSKKEPNYSYWSGFFAAMSVCLFIMCIIATGVYLAL